MQKFESMKKALKQVSPKIVFVTIAIAKSRLQNGSILKPVLTMSCEKKLLSQPPNINLSKHVIFKTILRKPSCLPKKCMNCELELCLLDLDVKK
jgi:hypothetical protein